MPNVKVNPVNTINVRVNQQNQKVVHGTSTFLGAADVQQEVNEIKQIANNAVLIAQAAYDTANTAMETKYDKTGGTISGDVLITNNLTVANTINADIETIDGGTFS